MVSQSSGFATTDVALAALASLTTPQCTGFNSSDSGLLRLVDLHRTRDNPALASEIGLGAIAEENESQRIDAMARSVVVELDLPKDWRNFRLPPALDQLRLRAKLAVKRRRP